MRTPILALLTATAALGLAACGSSGDGGEAKLEKAELAKKADEICTASGKEAAKVEVPEGFGQAGSSAAAASAYLGKIYPITKGELDRLRALKPADDVKADWDSFLAEEGKLVAFLKKILDKAKAKDPSGIQDLAQISTLAGPFKRAADKIGATACSVS